SMQLPQSTSPPALRGEPPVVQSASHPSPLVALPSSHCSPGSRTPSPQALPATDSVQPFKVPRLPPVSSTTVSVQVPFGSSPRKAASAPSPTPDVNGAGLVGSVWSLN